MTPDEMLVREAIRFTLERYNHNADTTDYDRHVEVFHTDVVMEVQNGAPLVGIPAIREAMRVGAQRRGAFEPGNFQRHNLSSTMIEFVGEGAADVTTYIIVITEKGLDHAGRYDGRFERVGNRWLIRRRRAPMEWGLPQSSFVQWPGTHNRPRPEPAGHQPMPAIHCKLPLFQFNGINMVRFIALYVDGFSGGPGDME